MLRQLLNKFRERNAKMNEAKEDMLISKTLQQRAKSADEREVERFMEERRQAQLKQQAQKIRDMRTRQAWEGTNNILQQKNIFLNHHSVLTDNPNLSITNRGAWL